jgi:hypothetical protein
MLNFMTQVLENEHRCLPSRLHASSRRSAGAAKVRAYRQRQCLDLAGLRVTVPQYEIAEFLIALGRLSVAEALDRRRSNVRSQKR